jgi:hypothetical protein
MSHTAIYNTHPNIASINGEGATAIAWDKEGNVVEIDFDLVDAEIARLEAKLIQDKIDAEDIKQAAQAKLAKLGLTPEDLKALLG